MKLRVLALAAIALATACSRTPPPSPTGEHVANVEHPGFRIPDTSALVLALDAGGDFTEAPDPSQPASIWPARTPTPFPLAVSAATAQPLGESALLAINRVGLKVLTPHRYPAAGGNSPEWRLEIQPLATPAADFSTRSVAISWGDRGEARFLLYRHPIFETTPASSPSSSLIAATLKDARVLEPGLGENVYAVYPVEPGSWLVQYRLETSDRVETSYARLTPDGTILETLERAAFERLATPAPLVAAPDALRVAASALVGPLLIEARLPDGSRKTFVRGAAGDAAPAWAQVLDGDADGVAAIIASDDWRVSIATRESTGLTATASYPAAPIPGARARDAVCFGGVIVILWEEDIFPDVGASGILAFKARL